MKEIEHPYDNFFRKNLEIFKEAYGLNNKLKAMLFLFFEPLGIHLNKKILFKNKDGYFLARTNSDVWVSLGKYGWEISPFLDIKKGLFVDVGANIGRFSVKMGNKLRNSGKVICFEPEEENFNALKKNISLNNLDGIVIPVKKGCYSSTRKINFYIHKGATRHSIFDKSDKKTTIGVVKLDDFLKNEKNIKLIKIDTEGADFEVLMGARQIIKKWRPVLIFEISGNHSQEKIKNKIYDFLKKEGYIIRKINYSNSIAFPKEKKMTEKQEKWLDIVKQIYLKTKRWKY